MGMLPRRWLSCFAPRGGRASAEGVTVTGTDSDNLHCTRAGLWAHTGSWRATSMSMREGRASAPPAVPRQQHLRAEGTVQAEARPGSTVRAHSSLNSNAVLAVGWPAPVVAVQAAGQHERGTPATTPDLAQYRASPSVLPCNGLSAPLHLCEAPSAKQLSCMTPAPCASSIAANTAAPTTVAAPTPAVAPLTAAEHLHGEASQVQQCVAEHTGQGCHSPLPAAPVCPMTAHRAAPAGCPNSGAQAQTPECADGPALLCKGRRSVQFAQQGAFLMQTSGHSAGAGCTSDDDDTASGTATGCSATEASVAHDMPWTSRPASTQPSVDTLEATDGLGGATQLQLDYGLLTPLCGTSAAAPGILAITFGTQSSSGLEGVPAGAAVQGGQQHTLPVHKALRSSKDASRQPAYMVQQPARSLPGCGAEYARPALHTAAGALADMLGRANLDDAALWWSMSTSGPPSIDVPVAGYVQRQQTIFTQEAGVLRLHNGTPGPLTAAVTASSFQASGSCGSSGMQFLTMASHRSVK